MPGFRRQNPFHHRQTERQGNAVPRRSRAAGTRILPRMAFISGGIEVSFPIAHTPVQIEAVHAFAEQIEDRLYVWCGEREVRYGMHWTVEYSLGEKDRFLTQRTTFMNPTSEAHAWMSWSNAALPARADSQFHFPTGRVLRHADVLEELEWSGDRRIPFGGLRSHAGVLLEDFRLHGIRDVHAKSGKRTLPYSRPGGNTGDEALVIRQRTTLKPGRIRLRSVIRAMSRFKRGHCLSKRITRSCSPVLVVGIPNIGYQARCRWIFGPLRFRLRSS